MTRIVGPPGSRRRRRFLVGPVLLAMFVGLVFIGGALAVHDEGLFQLDANVADDAAGDDWANLFPPQTDSAVVDTGIVADPAPATIFSAGGSKDYLGINNDPPNDVWTDGPWKHKSGNSPPKDEITNAYAAAYTKTEDGVPHTFIYFGMDRLATEGSANVGFWFFQGNVAPITSGSLAGSFSGEHQVGDILVLSEFSGGGEDILIKVFEWVGTGGDEGGGTLQTLVGGETGLPADCDDPNLPADDNVCANVNTAPILDATIPWNYVDRDGNRDIPTAAFFEGGIDLTDLVPGAGCVSNFLAETRSSFEVNAILKDFVHSSFNLCGDKSGVKFHDQNANGMRDGTGPTQEPGLAGWTINLYTDEPAGQPGHGVVELNQVALDTEITAANGSYSFPNLAIGNYIVCEDKQAGWVQSRPVAGQTLPSGETLATCPGSTTGYAFAMGTGDRPGNDFGNFQQGTISGTKFKDADGDGSGFEAGDPGVAGFEIRLYSDADGSGDLSNGDSLAATATTAANGNYSFTGLTPGRYVVCEAAKTDWNQADPDNDVCDQTGLNPPLDTPDLSDGGYAVNLASGQTFDADFVNTPLSRFDVRFFDLTGHTDGAISCPSVTGGTSSTDESATPETTFDSNKLPPGTYTCTITITDP
jgi:hypothetical protein